MSRSKSQRVTNVDDSIARPRLNEFPILVVLGAGSLDLQTPLLREQKRQTADVGVLLMSDLFGACDVTGNVAEHSEGRVGFVVVAMRILKPITALQAEGCGEGREHGFRNDAGASDEVVEDLYVVIILKNGRQSNS